MQFLSRISVSGALCVVCAIGATLSIAASLDDGPRYGFSASRDQSTIYAIDLKSASLAARIELDGAPVQALAADGLNALIISHASSQSLSLVDLTDSDLPIIDYRLNISPDYMVLSPLGDSVAIYDKSKRRLEVHALKRRAVLLSAENIDSSSDITFGPDGSVLYWVNSKTGMLHSIDLWSQRDDLSLAESGTGLSSLSRSADGLLGFVSGATSNEVFVINLRDFALVSTIRVRSGPGRPWGTADGRQMFIMGESDNTISAISTANLQVEYVLQIGARPVSVHSGWLDTVAAIVTASGEIVFIDAASGEILASDALNGIPMEAVVTSDSKTLVVPVSESGKLAFYDMRRQVRRFVLEDLPGDISVLSIAVSNNLCH